VRQSPQSLPRRFTACLTAILVVVDVTSVGCKSSKTPEAPAPTTAAAPAAGTPPPAGPATSQMSLDDLVAPIALYPDQLLGQLLVAAVNSQEVLDLGNWLLENQSLKSDAAPDAAKKAGFSPSAQYLAAFPQVVDNMCQELDWTKQLGEAFQSNQKGVMNAVQQKRAQAKQQGNLQSSPQMTVDTTTQGGQQIIEIKPADPQIIYVPQYNTTTVYTTPPAQTTTVVQEQSGVSTGGAVAIGLLSFGVGMAVGSALHHDDYYPYPAWGGGGMYYGGRPYYPPPYRPPYYPGYRPAYGYHPPANYHWNQYNHQTNIRVNNNNYYGRYNNNNNNRPGNNNNGYLGANNNNRPGQTNRPGGPGNNGYQGANRQPGANARPGSGMANANPGLQNRGGQNQGGNLGANRGGQNQPGNFGANRNNGSNAPGRNASAGPQGRPGAGSPGANNRAAAGRQPSGGGDRGFANNAGGNQGNRGAAAQQRQAPQRQPSNNGGAFGGGGGGGNSAKSARADSSRGRSSMGAPSARGGGGGGGGGKRHN
jgi:hypothetical protein